MHCCRRRSTDKANSAQQQRAAFEDDWEVVLAPEPRNIRFRRAIKKVVTLLLVRQTWSRVGRWLQKDRSHRNRQQRRVLQDLWKAWAVSHVRPVIGAFSHLERRNGVLRYR